MPDEEGRCYDGQGCPSQWGSGWRQGSMTAGGHRIVIVAEEVLVLFYI